VLTMDVIGIRSFGVSIVVRHWRGSCRSQRIDASLRRLMLDEEIYLLVNRSVI